MMNNISVEHRLTAAVAKISQLKREIQLEQRLTAVETEIKELKREIQLEQRLTAIDTETSTLKQTVTESKPSNWIQQISGIFKDEPAFDEVVAYGKEFRQSNNFSEESERINVKLEFPDSYFDEEMEETQYCDDDDILTR